MLISLATGVLVTKASSDGELGDEIVGQLFSMDRVLMMVGGALTVLGVFTPLPIYVFVPFGVALILAGRKLGDKKGEATDRGRSGTVRRQKHRKSGSRRTLFQSS